MAFGVKDIAGVQDLEERLNAPADIYIADRSWTRAVPVVSGIADLSGLAWSPSGDRIAFAGVYHGVRGIWFLSPGTGVVSLFSRTYVNGLAWSPDGRKLAAVINVGTARLLLFNSIPVDASP